MKGEFIMVKLFYDDILLGEVLTNHSMSIEDILNILNIDMDKYASEQGWDDWNFESLRTEWK
jgi:hypothetical protein